MGVAPEVRLVVKHTFLEFVEPAHSKESRGRAFTDTALVKDFDVVGSCNPSEADDVTEQEAITVPALGLSSPCLEPMAAVWTPELAWADQPNADWCSWDAFQWMPTAMAPVDAQPFWMAGWAPGAPEAAPFPEQWMPWLPAPLEPQELLPGDQACPGVAQPAEALPTPAASSSAAPPASQPEELADKLSAGPEESPEHAWKTTLMLRCLPVACDRDALLAVLDRLGFAGHYDLVYVPVDFSSRASLRYAFVNAVSPASARRLWARFDGFRDWEMPCEEACTACWSDPHQGLAAHVDRYRSSPVMHESMPDAWKPALFEGGLRVAFPPPTKAIKAPKVSRRRRTDAA